MFQNEWLGCQSQERKTPLKINTKLLKGEFIVLYIFDKLILFKSRMKKVVHKKTICASRILWTQT